MRCSIDLRKRVLEFIKSGGSKTEAARMFQVSRASVYVWLNSQQVISYKLPEPKQPRKLNLEELRGHFQKHPDQAQSDRAQQVFERFACSFDVQKYCNLSKV